MNQIAKKFHAHMQSLPYKDYGRIRNELCEHMGWSYWQYNRKLHGETFIKVDERRKIEEFFNTKIFES